ncbi:hypothetical protein DERP_014811 [Dermatophagoides pteronyssinus]|uniref:Secreted protein n=1 Tax=Dermatophagoides pteronyssinus TaxID=6956 RepID=A0ABQ8J2G4_DERPT|nr:hypothetical protein DERP_014811 [Dermatophagoides pteronyssinus]
MLTEWIICVHITCSAVVIWQIMLHDGPFQLLQIMPRIIWIFETNTTYRHDHKPIIIQDDYIIAIMNE